MGQGERTEVHVLQGKDGVTALGLACLRGDVEIVKLLLSRPEVDINIRKQT